MMAVPGRAGRPHGLACATLQSGDAEAPEGVERAIAAAGAEILGEEHTATDRPRHDIVSNGAQPATEISRSGLQMASPSGCSLSIEKLFGTYFMLYLCGQLGFERRHIFLPFIV